MIFKIYSLINLLNKSKFDILRYVNSSLIIIIFDTSKYWKCKTIQFVGLYIGYALIRDYNFWISSLKHVFAEKVKFKYCKSDNK